ncbi:RNA polymerase sigma factor [Maribacter stanieri]|uniref:RNA polymerase sigma-70 factor, ECF subfamily n=1 Tax=Maribacter stanieri TaxID=440514 RepID=A0A1I6HVT7_9FLAO|nr:RNA polymerase sigma factor [Maribacter stanieri]SFR58555.1 RNA polymerase sigma-70 factor, ECF subfamily [Maribacter stanieri]|tara:strand:+ start:913 stop:1407 length:495 start_codon:yes stop_codon:yes gene_type:complete
MASKENTYKNIYKENYAKVMRLCMGYTVGDEALAKDLAQETFIKVWQNLDGFRNESGIGTWIYRICVNTCLAEIRKQRKKDRNLSLDNIQVSDSDENPNEKEDMLVQLYSCIDKLSSINKAIILLELEGLPQLEISEIMGIKHEAIRTRVHRIKQQLTKCVNNE